MFLTVHAAAGAVLGRFIGHPLLAFLIGALSHFILDLVPHGDQGLGRWQWLKTNRQRLVAAAAIDFCLVIVFFLLWLPATDINELDGIVYGAAGAIFPDTLWGFHELTGTSFLKWYERSHGTLHRAVKRKITFKQGLLLQIVLLLALTTALIY